MLFQLIRKSFINQKKAMAVMIAAVAAGTAVAAFTLRFFEHSYWAMLEAARDPGLLVLRLGILLIIIGTPVLLIRSIYKVLTAKKNSE